MTETEAPTVRTPRRSWRRWVIGLVIAAVALAAVGGWIVARSTDSHASAEISLVPATAPGPDPFSASVAGKDRVAFPSRVLGASADLRRTLTADPRTGTLVAVGTKPGLYGGSNDVHVCDPQKLVSFLQQNPAKARAWARALGIAPSGIGAYVDTLTPVVLTSDTLVTNHGYRDGVAAPLQSVLQAGTAVLVDRTGTPRVKCNCGNPLTPPHPISLSGAHTTRAPWPGFATGNVAVVRPGPATDSITVVDINTGDRFEQPVGGGAATAGSSEVLVNDTPGLGSRIYRLAVRSRALTTVATVHDAFGRNLDIFDIAANSRGEVFAEAGSQVTRVDLSTGLATPVAVPSGFNGNGLAFDSNDVLYSASNLTVSRFDPATGASSVVASLPASSSGDIAFTDATTLYATVSASGADQLVRVDVASGDVTTVGSTEASSVYGLFAAGGKLYGVTAFSSAPSCRGGDLLRIDTQTGRSHRLGCVNAKMGGATTRPTRSAAVTGSGPPCTNAAVQSVLAQGSTFTGTPICSGKWAVIFPQADTGDEFTMLLQASGGEWRVASGTLCTPDGVPAEIFRACNTN